MEFGVFNILQWPFQEIILGIILVILLGCDTQSQSGVYPMLGWVRLTSSTEAKVYLISVLHPVLVIY